MQVTNVKIKKIEGQKRLRAIASITIDDEFVVHEVKLIEGKNGLQMAMPSRKAASGRFMDIAHPINPEVRAVFEEAILEAYKNAEDDSEEEDA